MSRKRITYRPSKAQSILGGVVGGLFVLLGIFVVIPSFGLFGIVWTLAAAGIAATNLYHAFGRTYAGPRIEVEDEEDAPAARGPVELNAQARLEQLEQLKTSGLISEEEYQEKRQQILNSL